MNLLTHCLIVLAYALAAIFAGLVAPQFLPFLGPDIGILAGIVVFFAAAVLHEILSRRLSEDRFRAELLQVRRFAAETGTDLENARRDVVRLRNELTQAEETSQARIDAEIAMLKPLLGQLSQHLSGQNLAVRPSAAWSGPDGDLLQVVTSALQDSRIDLYLQPIVSLPQRKIRYYEAFSRLRDVDGTQIMPARYLPVAADAGLLNIIDNLLLFRCVQLIRKLKRKNRSTGFFCNISAASLQDAAFFHQFTEFLSTDPDLVDSLIFEIAAADFAAMDNTASTRLDRLGQMGFGFSLDQVQSLDVDYANLARRHFRFVKIEADRLLADDPDSKLPIVLDDLKEAFRRAGVDLIAEKVETEKTLLDLLEVGVDFGQGYLFGEPRLGREDF